MPTSSSNIKGGWPAVLLARILPGLPDIAKAATGEGLRQWVLASDIQFYSTPSPSKFVLNYSNASLFTEHFANEVSRFACASRETLANINLPPAAIPRSRAWALIQLYYAAFYSAHSLLRLDGLSLTQLDRGHANHLSSLASAYGYGGQILPGFYFAGSDSNATSVDFQKEQQGGGSHDALWSRFRDWLNDRVIATKTIKTISTTDANKIISGLDLLADTLSSPPASKGTWLSMTRNRINYRHEFSAWYPWNPRVELRLADLLEMARRGDLDQLTSALNRPPNLQFSFAIACATIIALSDCACRILADRSNVRNGFLGRTYLALDSLATRPTG